MANLGWRFFLLFRDQQRGVTAQISFRVVDACKTPTIVPFVAGSARPPQSLSWADPLDFFSSLLLYFRLFCRFLQSATNGSQKYCNFAPRSFTSLALITPSSFPSVGGEEQNLPLASNFCNSRFTTKCFSSISSLNKWQKVLTLQRGWLATTRPEVTRSATRARNQ